MILGAVFFLFCVFANAQQKPIDPSGIVAGRVMVKMKAGPSSLIQKNLQKLSITGRTENFQTGLQHFDAVARQFKTTRMTRVFPAAGRMEAKQHKYGLDRWYILEVDPNISIASAISSFKQIADVDIAQPAFKIKNQPIGKKVITSSTGKALVQDTKTKTLGTKAKTMDAYKAPFNDPFYPLQWHYHNVGQEGGYAGSDIDLEPAWKITAGTPNVIVDVVDEGADANHVDLAANMWVNQAELNGLPGVDDDGNGYVDDIHGYNFADNTNVISPGDHGTHTSGTIAAVNNNGIGVCGIAGGTGNGDGARIMNSQIFGASSGNGATTAAAIVYGANNGAVISQNSWGYTTPDAYDQAVLDAIDYFIAEAGRDVNGNQTGPMNGGVVIFAAGNSNSSDPYYPGYYPNVIAVGATTAYDNRASYSNFGDWVDISAPGGDENDTLANISQQMVVSLFANNQYGYMAGTSMATPHVSGVAALIVSQFGKMGFTNQDLKNRLLNSVHPFIAMDPAYNGLMGSGRLDAAKALQPDKKLPPTTITDLKGTSNTPVSVDLTWTAPSDPDNINASNYIVYYSTHPIDSTQKDTLPKMLISKAQAAGLTEKYNLGGLFPSTTYYISVTAKDLWGNESSFSNIAKVTTIPGPIVLLPTDTISMSINVTTSPTKSTSFLLKNAGLGSMTWSGVPTPVSTSWARTDGGFNDTLTYVDPTQYPDVWVGDDQRVNFSAATRFDVKKKFNLTHVQNYLQLAGVTAPITIYIYKGGADPSKGTLLLKQSAGTFTDWSGLEQTKLNGMYLFQPGDWFWVVYQYDPAYGQVQGADNNATAAQEQYFLTSSDQGQTWKTITSQYAAVRFYTLALSDEGYPGGLVTLSPTSGTIAGLGSATIGVTGNAATIRNGVYYYNLQISSNDLNNPNAGVPMVVTVSGQKGTLTAGQSLLDCKNVFIGKGGDATITLYNAGLSKLYNFSYTTNNALFSSSSLPDSLYPGDSVQFTVTFTPTAASQQLAKIQIKTNDGTLNLSASGIGVKPPVMTLTGVPVQIVAKADSLGTGKFTISNKTGKYPLSFSMPVIAAINKYKAKTKLARGTDPTNDYAWIDSQEPDGPVYSWDDIAATGKDITAQLKLDPRSSNLVQLGFPMKFYGDTIRQIYVNSQGTLTLNEPGDMNIVSLYLPTPQDGITGEIAVSFFEQVLPVVGPTEHVYVKYVPGKLIVQWNDVELFNQGSFDFPVSTSLGKATFQAVLYSNGKIEMNYKTVNNTWVTQGYPQIGLESKDETKGVSVNAYDYQPAPFIPMDGESLLFVPVMPSFITAIAPASGAVNPGDSVSITVTASAAGLIDSTYFSSIALTTNDPLNEKLDIPVVLTVTGIQGMMLKTDTLAFGSIYKNATSEIDAVLFNAGTKPVKLISTAISNAAFTTTQDTVTVPAMSELHIPITFAPKTEGSYAGTLTVTTDDSAKAVFTVVLSGSGKAAPSLSYSLTGGQTNTLSIGQTNPAVLTLKNNGDADLNIMVERPQWLAVSNDSLGILNGVDSAHTYSIHNNIDSNSAAYNWVELAFGKGTSSFVTNPYAGNFQQQVSLPFAFPYYGKKYSSLFINFQGDISLNAQTFAPYIYPTLPAPAPYGPGGYIAGANTALSQGYDWTKLIYNGLTYYYADSEKLVVEYYMLYGDGSGTVTFENILYKDGRIKMLYQSGATESTFTQDFFVGIQNQDGTDASVAYNRSLWYKNRGVVEFVPSVPFTLKAGQSVNMPATWTTVDMTDGVYKDNLILSTNDPLNTSVHIPLELDVNGAVSMKTSDSVNFGKVVAAYRPSDGASEMYTQPVSIKNNGTKTIMVSGISLSNIALALDELTLNPDLFDNPIPLAPGDELLYHVDFTPDSTMAGPLSETLTVNSDYPTTVVIPVTATVILPPVVTTDTTLVKFTLQQTDSASKYVQLGNMGKGSLDYTLSLQYIRPGISYNSTANKKPLLTGAKLNRVERSLMGNDAGKKLLGSQGSTVLDTEPKFADSILAYDPTGHTGSFLGPRDPTIPAWTATKFNGGEKGIYMTHVATLYRTDNMDPTTISFRIRLGTNINTSMVVYSQTVNIQGDSSDGGHYLIAKLDSAIMINAYETFWVEWDYNVLMSTPQGFLFVSSDQLRPQTYFAQVQNSGWFEITQIINFVTAAYSTVDSTGGWLTLSPIKGSVDIGKTQPLMLTAHGPRITPPDQSVSLMINSNDPFTPVQKVIVLAHVDQAPILTNHDTLFVHEADTLNALIPATDDENGPITISLISPDTAVVINHTDTSNYFVYRPGYNDAGLHTFPIQLADQNGNKRTDSLFIMVLNTNRAPVVIHHLETRTISLQGAALRLSMDTVFMDPDADRLIYRFAGVTNPIVGVYTDTTGETSLIPLDTGHIMLAFTATDIYGASATDTLSLFVKNNTAPVAADIPNFIIDKGTSRTIDLATWFTDADSSDILMYLATMDSSGFASLGINGSDLTMTGLNAGNCLVTIMANDGNGGSVGKSFILTVLNNQGNIIDDYHIVVAPNPVHSISNILFELGTEKKVHIDLIGMDGKLQSVIFDGMRSPGSQSLQVNYSSLPAGNYLLKFTIDNKTGVIQIAKL